MKAVVAAFNQEKALVGAFSVIVQPVVEPMEHYTALGWTGRLEPGPGRRLDGEAGHCSTVAGVMEAADHCYTHPGEYQQQ